MKKLLILLAGIVLVSSQAFALPINMTNLTPFTGTAIYPEDKMANSKLMFYMVERTDYTLLASLKVDFVPPADGTSERTYAGTTLDPGSISNQYISANTVVSSYFIHFDRVDDTSFSSLNPWADTTLKRSASLTFGPTEKILGIMTFYRTMDESNSSVGKAGITYANLSLSNGLETSGDTLVWHLNEDGGTTLSLNLSVANDQIDDVRVITGAVTPAVRTPSPVPEPATMLLLGSGLIGLAGFGRKKLFKK